MGEDSLGLLLSFRIFSQGIFVFNFSGTNSGANKSSTSFVSHCDGKHLAVQSTFQATEFVEVTVSELFLSGKTDLNLKILLFACLWRAFTAKSAHNFVTKLAQSLPNWISDCWPISTHKFHNCPRPHKIFNFASVALDTYFYSPRYQVLCRCRRSH